jgi:hypothetical protein
MIEKPPNASTHIYIHILADTHIERERERAKERERPDLPEPDQRADSCGVKQSAVKVKKIQRVRDRS